MTKLYDISKDYIQLLDSDIDPHQLSDCLDNMVDAFEDKAHNIIAVATTLDSDINAIDAQIKRLQERKKAINSNVERLKEYLRYNMEVSGITKINHPLFSITLGKPTVTCEVTDQSLLPDDYVTVKTEIKPDKRKILKDLKEGVDVEGAVLSEGKSRLLIK
jgi:uncharacterized protein YeeX (DUF496 family)